MAIARRFTTEGARALVTGDEGDFLAAVGRLEASPMPPYLARAHLLYGEWLRRQGRRRDSRRQLRTAHELLSDIGMAAFVSPRRRRAARDR